MLAENNRRKPCQVRLTRIQKSNFNKKSFLLCWIPGYLGFAEKVSRGGRVWGVGCRV
ncbi:hypothetical protein C789_2456 [Microcystis aeruginosa FACHB-905 = DIANCHI905]|uniref:Uncharacterized protein n=1 Tax=Microcystis aeruginosa PCC 7806SL TaxID=1903187 RepID=A0AB33BV51_MICA7|nr:hypothetical protein BH695_4571 [Microcystis aeruginosa PCC 7806SL]ELS47746.1 hypothetical protein C789_2456 [Microcystis aeruginosa FACHB-905 = DIANCHI905]